MSRSSFEGMEWCSMCRLLLPLGELLAWWSKSSPDDIRYVCRPQKGDGRCFNQIGPASHFVIATAVEKVSSPATLSNVEVFR
jgi:hypothetical protein